MKKNHILTFCLTIVMGLFVFNQVQAQDTTPPWTKDNNWWTLEGTDWLSVEGRLRALESIVSPTVRPPNFIDRFDIGLGGDQGGHLEMYRKTHTDRAGQLRFVYGGGEFGQLLFTHFDGTNYVHRLSMDHNGNMKLNGKITAKEIEVKFEVWPDFVFADDFDLMSLHEVESFIKQNRHLPGVPSEAEVMQNGVGLGEVSTILLQKVEELTLHIIELNRRIEELEK